MPHATLKLKPGVDVIKTPALNEAAYSSTQLARFLPERDNMGLIQKLGGWKAYYGTAMSSVVRALKGWKDLNNQDNLAIGAQTNLSVLTGGNLNPITPQVFATNTLPNFSTTLGSTTITVKDVNFTPSTLDYVNYVTPVSVGGIVLSGPYDIQSPAGNTYIITADYPATTSALYPGTVYSFKTTSGSNIVTCTFANHGYSIGREFYIGVSTTLGGITLFGSYIVASVPNENTFTFAAGTTAGSTAGPLNINSGFVNSTYYISNGPATEGTGFGVGGYGVGGFGLGTVQTGSTGTPITATDWTLDNFGQNLIACPAGGPIYSYTPGGALQQAQLVSSYAPLVNDGIFVAMPERQVVAWGSSFTLQQDALLMRWSDAGDSTVWIGTATNQAGSYRIPNGSRIVTCLQGPQQGLIWTDLDCWAMQYVGPPLIYGFNKIGSNCGAIGRHSAGQLNNIVYWMSQKQFFVLTGNGPQIIPCPVWDVIFQNINTNQTDKVRCAVNSQFNEIAWYYPSLNTYTALNSGSSYTIQSLGSFNITASVTSGSKLLTVTSLPSSGKIFAGQVITGTGIPTGTTIASFGNGRGDTGTYYLSANANSTQTAQTFSVVANNFVAYGASSNTVGQVFVSNSTVSALLGGGTVLFNENDSYVKYNVSLQQWDYGSLGRTAWIDQSVLGTPIGAGTDNWLYQHEIGNNAAVGNNSTNAMLTSMQTGYFQLNEADNLVFIDQVWPDMKWGNYNGVQNATVNITFYATNYPGDTPVVYGPYPMTQATEYISVRIRARLMSIGLSSNDSDTFWRLGAIRYRYQLDGRF
jgi:hypothetical protein